MYYRYPAACLVFTAYLDKTEQLYLLYQGHDPVPDYQFKVINCCNSQKPRG